MAEAAATYPPGMSVTRTTAPQAPPYAYALALMDAQDKYRTGLDQWQRANWYRQTLPTVPRGTNASPAAAAPRRDAPMPAVQERRMPSQLERAQERAQILKLQAAERGPRLMYSGSGFNLPQRLEMDDQHMNAYEREMYLPQGSSMLAGGLSDEQQLAPLRTREEEARLAYEARAAEAAAARDAAIARARYGYR